MDSDGAATCWLCDLGQINFCECVLSVEKMIFISLLRTLELTEGPECSSGVLTSMYKALCSIPSTSKNLQNEPVRIHIDINGQPHEQSQSFP